VLVTRLRYLGDIAMSSVVLEVLHRGDPDLVLGFLCEEEYAPLLAHHDVLGHLHALRVQRRGRDAQARRVSQPPGTPPQPSSVTATGGGTIGVVNELRRRRYDLAVDLLFNPRSAWLLRASGIPLRIGGAVGRWRRRLYTHSAAPPSGDERPRFRALAPGGLGDHLARLAPLVHGPEEQPFLDWFEAAYAPGGPLPRVALPAERGGGALAALQAAGVDPAAEYLLLSPGATWRTKEWPLECWIELANALGAGQRRPMVVLAPPAGAGRYAELERLADPARAVLLPPLPLADALEVVAAARLVVSVDGGIMHAAVALRRPTVALFGPTDPAIWFPYERDPRFRVLAARPRCHPCDRHVCDDFVCLPAVTGAAASRTVLELLASTEPRRSAS
jgi:ADP-heptose:LPS heptosyltransferase